MGTSAERRERQLDRLGAAGAADAEFHVRLADERHRFRFAALLSCRVPDVIATSDVDSGDVVVKVTVLPASCTCAERVDTILRRVDCSVRELVAAERGWR